LRAPTKQNKKKEEEEEEDKVCRLWVLLTKVYNKKTNNIKTSYLRKASKDFPKFMVHPPLATLLFSKCFLYIYIYIYISSNSSDYVSLELVYGRWVFWW